jgi:hypothetical protein
MFMVERSWMVRTIAVFALLVASVSLSAQVPVLDPRSPNDKPVPVVTFEFTFAGANPPHYGIAVEAGGRAAYRSDDTAPTTPGEASGTPYLVKFVISRSNADRIFELAKSLNYLKGDYEYHGGRIANMGSKTLTFKNGETENATTYNYTQNQNLQQLTTIFQGVANTLEYGRRLARLYRYDKLGLDKELRAMEEDTKRNYLAELQLDEAILKQIAGDASIMNISRRRADNILGKIPNESAESGKQ